MRLATRFGACLLAVLVAALGQLEPSPAQRAARTASTQYDYQETLKRPGLGGLGPGVDGMHAGAPSAVIYAEANVRRYVLPRQQPDGHSNALNSNFFDFGSPVGLFKMIARHG